MDHPVEDQDEDLELQLALALSIAEAEGPPASTTAGPNPGDATQQPMSLAAALAAALTGAAGAGPALQVAPAQQQPQQVPVQPAAAAAAQQQQQQQQQQPMQAMQQLLHAALQAAGVTASAAQQQPLAAVQPPTPPAPVQQQLPQPQLQPQLQPAAQPQATAAAPSVAQQQAAFFQQLQAALQAGLGAAAGGATPQAAPAVAPLAPAAAAAAHPAVAAAAPAAPTAPVAPLPAWTSQLTDWWKGGPEPVKAVSLPAPDLSAFNTALSHALKHKVSAGAATSAVGDSFVYKATTSGDTTTVSLSDLEAAVKVWLLRPVNASKSKLRALHDAFDELPGPNSMKGQAQVAVDAFAALLGRMAFVLLRDDEDDLYSDKGQYTGEFIRDLKNKTTMCAPFVDALAAAVSSESDARAWHKVTRDVLNDLKNLKTLGTDSSALDPYLTMLDLFTAPVRVQQAMAGMLLQEVQAQQRADGKKLEASSLLTAFLQISPLVDPLSVLRRDVTSRAREAFVSLKGYPAPSHEVGVTSHILHATAARLHHAGHEVLTRIIKATRDGSCREAVLAWWALTAQAGMERTRMGERGISGNTAEMTLGASDGFMVNATALCLRFARPFVQGYLAGSPKFADLLERHLSPTYYASQPQRMQDLGAVASLAGERGQGLTSVASSGYLPPAPGSKDAPSFIADVFFLTQKMIHTGLMPAVFRFQRLQEMSWDLHKAEYEAAASGPRGRAALPLQYQLLIDCSTAGLLEPQMAEDAVQFALLQVAWLRHLASSGNIDAFQSIPDYVLSDLLSWITFLIRWGQTVLVASKDMGLLMSGLVMLLDRPACVRSPLLHAKIASLFQAMLQPQLELSRRTVGGALGRTVMGAGEQALSASILGTSTAQHELVPALMRAYVAADHVVGLDVDRDAFDKFTHRHCIDSILGELWHDDKCRANIVSLATLGAAGGASNGGGAAAAGGSAGGGGANATVFYEYISCLFNSLIYLFKDSLDRLQDIAKVEAAKADEAGWAALPADGRKQQEQFYRSQQHTCKGFMRMAVASLKWLGTLASDPRAVGAFLRQPLAGRAAYAITHFLELLVGPKCAELKLERPEQYTFDRPSLMESCVGLMLRLAGAPGGGFIAVVAAEPDFDEGVLQQALQQLEAGHQVMTATGLQQFLAALAAARGGAQAAGGAVSPAQPPLKKRKSSDEHNLPAPAVARSAAAAVAAAGAGARQTNAAAEPAAVGAATAAAAIDELSLPGQALPDQELQAAYASELGEVSVGTFDSGASRAYHSAFTALAAEEQGTTPAKMKRLNKELRDLQARTRLPCEPAASIFLRHDADRLDKMRALVTGPADTPYAYGCFFFDLLYPATYPNIAMSMHFETTGQGRVRFNPNLYADGKVCLSLINTWHASHESEKWNPALTTTFQVLLSIQSMIFVQDPYYNEPAHEAAKGTDVGRSSSAAYNADLRLQTMRWAMIDKLKNPPPGFEDVVRSHFRLLRHRVLDAAKAWVREAAELGDDTLTRRMEAAARELHALLAAL